MTLSEASAKDPAVFPPVSREDLSSILLGGADSWRVLAGQRIFLTGGTGFFGRWLLESIDHANAGSGLGIRVTVLTRSPERFHSGVPHLAGAGWLSFLTGDVRTFSSKDTKFDYIIHAATPVMAQESPLELLSTIVDGTRHTLDFAVACCARRFLLTSSGAVYGQQPSDIAAVGEDYLGAPNTGQVSSAYGEGKRVAELLCATYHKTHGLKCTIARCFSFVGPHLPLDSHFAIGNFIRDALAGRSIRISGDGTPRRSYLYASDLVVWLLATLTKGEPLRPYNIGSPHAYSIADLADCVRKVLSPSVSIEIAETPIPGKPPRTYVPSVTRIQRDLGVRQTINLETAIRRTADWHAVRLS